MALLFERSLEIIRIGSELREESARLNVLGRALKRGPRTAVEAPRREKNS